MTSAYSLYIPGAFDDSKRNPVKPEFGREFTQNLRSGRQKAEASRKSDDRVLPGVQEQSNLRYAVARTMSFPPRFACQRSERQPDPGTMRLSSPARLDARLLPALTSTNSPGRKRLLANLRSARNGEMNDTSTIRPASTINRATSAMRRIFSTRSASVNPRSRFRPWRTLSPSSRCRCYRRQARALAKRASGKCYVGRRYARQIFLAPLAGFLYCKAFCFRFQCFPLTPALSHQGRGK